MAFLTPCVNLLTQKLVKFQLSAPQVTSRVILLRVDILLDCCFVDVCFRHEGVGAIHGPLGRVATVL